MSNSLTRNYLTMSVMRHMWNLESIGTGEGQDGFLEEEVTERSDEWELTQRVEGEAGKRCKSKWKGTKR